MTDKEIIKALEEELKTALIINRRFEESNDTENPDDHRFIALLIDTIDLINRQQAEIERLTDRCSDCCMLKAKNEIIHKLKEQIGGWQKGYCDIKQEIKTAKTEAIKEFAERLKEKLDCDVHTSEGFYFMVSDTIDNLAKEMVGEDK